jgi:hypothetical protein
LGCSFTGRSSHNSCFSRGKSRKFANSYDVGCVSVMLAVRLNVG